MKKSSIAIIRQRGQITIPDTIRQAVGWVEPEAVVTVSMAEDSSIRIEPYQKEKKPDWDKIWAAIHASRAVKGRSVDLGKFIIEDREKRR
jgi:bifunctional DNA-binding transcriptional regulator/antitoxin component of YhaV-PrlF toxin-antitoxin module